MKVLEASGVIKGCSRKIIVIACYVPPNYAVGRGKGVLDFVAAAVLEAKRRLDDPVIMVAGTSTSGISAQHCATSQT